MNSYLTIYIYNEGIGIRKEEILNMGAFIQFDRLLYEQQGPGLGLAIANKLVEIHHGAINIVSEYEKNVTVIVTLPIKV